MTPAAEARLARWRNALEHTMVEARIRDELQQLDSRSAATGNKLPVKTCTRAETFRPRREASEAEDSLRSAYRGIPITARASGKICAGSYLSRVSVLAIRRFLFVPGSSPGKRRAGRHAVQTARLWAVRNPNKSQEFPVPDWNGSLPLPLDRFFWPACKACNVLGSNNRVPERTLDPQR
jgi:hypothetical protein